MSRIIKPYKRKKGSPKQRRNLESFNIFTDELMCNYFMPCVENQKSKGKNKNFRNEK